MKGSNGYAAGVILLGITLIGSLFATMPPAMAISLGLIGDGNDSSINRRADDAAALAPDINSGKKAAAAAPKNEFALFVEKRNEQIKCIEEKYSVTIVQADYLFDDYTFTSSKAKYPAGGEMMDFKGAKMQKLCAL